MQPLSCISEKQNIGVSSCKKIPELITQIITTPNDFSLSEADANDPAKWQEALLASKRNRIYLWPTAALFENAAEDAVYEETVTSTQKVRDGRYRFRLSFAENLELHKAMYSHNGGTGRVFLIDIKGNVTGTTKTDGSFAGIRMDMLSVEKLMLNDGSVTTKTPVYVSMKDNKDIDRDGAMIDGDFVSDLIGLTSVKLEVIGSPTATEIQVSVKSTLDNSPLTGLVVGDFVLLDGSSAAQTIDSIAEPNDDGIYTLTGTGLVTGTLSLVTAANLSIPGFEAKEAIDITI